MWWGFSKSILSPNPDKAVELPHEISTYKKKHISRSFADSIILVKMASNFPARQIPAMFARRQQPRVYSASRRESPLESILPGRTDINRSYTSAMPPGRYANKYNKALHLRPQSKPRTPPTLSTHPSSNSSMKRASPSPKSPRSQPPVLKAVC